MAWESSSPARSNPHHLHWTCKVPTLDHQGSHKKHSSNKILQIREKKIPLESLLQYSHVGIKEKGRATLTSFAVLRHLILPQIHCCLLPAVYCSVTTKSLKGLGVPVDAHVPHTQAVFMTHMVDINVYP